MTTLPSINTKQDILQLLLKQEQASAQELAERLGVTPQAIRRHLKDLDDEGLIGYHSVQVGMGRPQHLYQLSSAGRERLRLVLSDRAGKGQDEFALGLLDTLAETVGKEQMQSILRKQWQRKAIEYQQQLGNGSLTERVAGLVKLRQAEGYMAECYPASEGTGTVESGEGFIFTEYNCAISQIAQSFPGVCDHELEMFAIALPDCSVNRTHWLVNGEHRCGYLIRAK